MRAMFALLVGYAAAQTAEALRKNKEKERLFLSIPCWTIKCDEEEEWGPMSTGAWSCDTAFKPNGARVLSVPGAKSAVLVDGQPHVVRQPEAVVGAGGRDGLDGRA